MYLLACTDAAGATATATAAAAAVAALTQTNDNIKRLWEEEFYLP